MTAALAVGGTLAYLTDTDEDVNVMTVGKVKIDQLEYERVDPETNGDDAVVQEFHNNKPLYPAVTEDGFDWDTTDRLVDWDQIGKDGYDSGIWNPDSINNEQDKMVFVKNKGDFDAYVRTVFAFEAGSYETLEEYLADVHFNLNDTDWTWQWSEPPVEIGGAKYFIATATYNEVLAPGALTEISLSQIALDPSVTNEDIAGFGETYQVLVQSQAVQADGFESAPIALAEAFGELIFDGAEDETPPFEVNPDDVPFEDDNPVDGTGLYNALHFMNADAVTNISAQVNTITFGLNKDYPTIADTYDGALVDEEQDTKAYAYYVPSNGGYDIYVLSDSKIYAPKNSSNLFAEMTRLTSVNTEALDVSRMQDCMRMFRNCNKLTELDTTGWDTSAVTTTNQMFSGCTGLKNIIGVENWDTSACENMMGTFYQCRALNNVDISDWETGNVTNMRMMFRNCDSMTEIDLGGWDVSKVENFEAFIYENPNLLSVDVTDFKCMSGTNLKWMFGLNPKLQVIDATGMTTPSAKNIYCMFLNNGELEYVHGTGNWDLSKAEDIDWLFQNNSKLKYIDGTNWGLDSAPNASGMFFSCSSLETVEGSENWNLGNVTTMYAMFYNCPKLSDLDVSGWDTSKVTNMDSMFRGAKALKALDVTNWDVSSVTTFRSMFSSFKGNAGDIPLEVFDMSNWYAPNAEDIGYMFYGCSKLKTVDFSGWKTTKIKYMGHTFSDCWGLENFDFSGWETSNLITMDACFNNCESVKVLDLSMFNMSSLVELTQTFEYCYKLEQIIGIETWVTPNLRGMEEAFSHCYALKELDLSGLDTRKVSMNVGMVNGSTMSGFGNTFYGMSSIQKLVLGENFSLVGDGTVSENLCVKLPNPASIDGNATKWYNAANDTYYSANEIPGLTAATYIAAIEPAEG